MAMPDYLEAIAMRPGSERSSLLRYQIALRWLEFGKTAEALAVLAPVIDREPDNAIVSPLYRSLSRGSEHAELPATDPEVRSASKPVSKTVRRSTAQQYSASKQEAVLRTQIRLLLPAEAAG